MTENEAIEILNNTPLMRYERIYEKNLGHKSQVGTALSMAISALEMQEKLKQKQEYLMMRFENNPREEISLFEVMRILTELEMEEGK